MTVTTRAARREDVAGLLEMMADFNALEDLPWPRSGTEDALVRLLADPQLGLVQLVVAETVLGYFVITWGFDLEWGGRDAYLTEFYVLPEGRGRGIGRAALREAERIAGEHGARALHLMVRPENAAAFRLYRGAGFAAPPRVFLSKAIA